MIDEPKVQVYTILSSVSGIHVYQERPEVIAIFPSVTYILANNTPEYTLSKDVGRQNIVVKVDIWTEDSVEASNILKDIELAMRAEDYLLGFRADVPEPGPDGLTHITTQFIY